MTSRPRLRETHVTLAHGAGGKASSALVNEIFVTTFANETLSELTDAARLPIPNGASGLAMSTDSFVVKPTFFPGGSVGDLAINGTVNDLACMGARPVALTAGFVIEEGFLVDDLRRIANDMKQAADVVGVPIVTGDTKVVESGAADGIYVNTAGLGAIPTNRNLGAQHVRPGDAIIVSGAIADHGTAVMIARGDLGVSANVQSDTASIVAAVEALFADGVEVHWMRDPTRGGVGTVCNELAQASNLTVELNEAALPVRSSVNAVCELLGIDPLYVACEGRVIIVVPDSDAQRTLDVLTLNGCESPTIIGQIGADETGTVQMHTRYGGVRLVDMLVGDPLPRIC